MASITIDTAKSNGKYLRLTVTESSYSTRNNTSVVTWTLQSLSDYYEQEVNHSVSAVTVTINGTQVYYKAYTAASSNAFPAKNGSTSGTLTITHNTNGAKTITCKLEGEVDSWVPTGRTKDLKLTTLDRSAPTVSFTIGSYTDNKVTFTANVSASCDLWQYSLNDGAWTTFYSTNTSTAQTYTIPGLSPNTSYTLKVRARKYSNYVYGTTSNVSFKTYGGSLINSVNTVTADASTVSIAYSATVYNSDVTHTLELKNGSTTILTFSGISVVSGNNTITLSSSKRTTLLNAMSTIKSFTGTFVLRTYVGSTEIGSGTSRTATVQTTATNSAPTFSGFTYVDGNSTTVAVTGNNQILIQNKSSLMITCSAATAKNGASISSYSVSAGSVSKSSTSTSINVGLIPNTGTVPVTVTAIDSRGYSKSVTVNVTVLAYNDIAFTQYSGRRENEIENTIQVAIQGALTALTVSGTNKNALVTLRYRYKETSSSSWSTWYNVTSAASVTSTGFTYNNNYLVSLDSEKSWNIEFNASDKLTSDTITLTITQGIPLISYRPKQVGVNVREPRGEVLDVGGGIIADNALLLNATYGVTDIPRNADLYSETYFRVGQYCCSQNTDVATLSHCPTEGYAFMMNVYSPIQPQKDFPSDRTIYRVREILTYTGLRYIQEANKQHNGSWSIHDWEQANASNWLVARTYRPSSLDFTHIYNNSKVHARLDIVSSSVNPSPYNGDGYVLTFMWDNIGAYDTQVFIPNSGGHPSFRKRSNAESWPQKAIEFAILETVVDYSNTYGMTANTWVDTISYTTTKSGYYMMEASMNYSNSYPLGIAIYSLDGSNPLVYSMDSVPSNTADNNLGFSASTAKRWTSACVWINSGVTIKVRCKGGQTGNNKVWLTINRLG